MIITALLGTLWGVVYLARRSVVAPMVSHASFNLIEVIGFGLRRLSARLGMRRELAVLAAAFVVSLPLVTPRIYASDEVQYFAYLRSLWFDRDVSFENEYQHFYDAGIARSRASTRRTSSGRPRPAGASASRRSARRCCGARSTRWPTRWSRSGAPAAASRDGYGAPYVRAVAYGSAVYGWLAIVLGWAMAHRARPRPRRAGGRARRRGSARR